MVQTNLLKEAIKDSGIKSEFLANQLGISRQAFHKKINTGKSIKTEEAFVLKKFLCLDNDRFCRIFFAAEGDCESPSKGQV